MTRNTIITAILLATVTAVTPSCNHDAYETGDGGLSYLHADYADITIAGGKVTGILTDDDTHLMPSPNLTVSSQMPPDTTLRRLIHYTMQDAAAPVEIVKLTSVSVLPPHDKTEIEEMKTAPVKLAAAWMARNQRYINLQLGLMVGNTNDTSSPQLVQIVRDSIHTHGKGAIFLTLYHDQAGMPEYYTQETHLSLPLDRLVPEATQPDTVSITVNTYSGTVTKQFIKQ